MIEVTFKQLEWVKGTSTIQSGFKNNYVPKGAIAGGYGTYRIVTPPELNLTVQADDGTLYKWDMAEYVREITGWQRLSEKRVLALRNAFVSKERFQLDERLYGIYGLEELVGLRRLVESCMYN